MKILIVEDHQDIAENIDDFFSPKGHHLDFALDGQVAWNLVQEYQFDVIVLDLKLPRLGGMALCKKIREEAKLTTPILMLTAMDQLETKIEGFHTGADDYLVKPFSVRELEVRLMSLVKRVGKQDNISVLSIADLNFDTHSLKIHRSGQEITLNPIQRKILEKLMLASPNVVSRTEIEAEVWGPDPPDKDILRSHIYGLRTAIDKPFSVKLIHTVHGAGYRVALE